MCSGNYMNRKEASCSGAENLCFYFFYVLLYFFIFVAEELILEPKGNIKESGQRVTDCLL